MPYQGKTYAIQFGRQGMVSHPNRLLATADQLLIAENAAFDRDFAHRPVTFEYYDAAGIEHETAPGTWSGGNVTWTGLLAGYPSTVSAAFVADVTTVSAVAQASPWTFAVGGAAAAGVLCVLSVGFRNANVTVASVIDSVGNVWIRSAWVIGNAAPQEEQWASLLTTALAPADTVTIFFAGGGAPSNVVAVIESYSGVLSPIAAGFGGITTVLDATVTIAASYMRDYPVLLVGSVAAISDIATHALTPGGGYTLREAKDIAGSVQVNQISTVKLAGSQIIAQFDWIGSEEFSSGAILATTVAGSKVVTLTPGPQFWRPGDEIIVGGETHIVASVTGPVTMETLDAWTASLGPVIATRRSGPTIITASLSGKLYREYPSAGPNYNHGTLAHIELKTGLNTSQRRGRFIAAGKEVAANKRKLFYFNGVDPIQVLAGDDTTTHDITTKAADWSAAADPGKQPINGTVHRDVLFAFGNLNDPHRLYYSTTTDHEVFQGGTAGSLRIASQVGERLFCASTYRGTLFLWKYPRGIFYLDDSDLDYTKWSYRTHSMAIGCAPSPYAVIPVDDDILFVDANAHLHMLSAVDTLGGVASSDLTRQLGLQQWVTEHIDQTALDTLTATYHPTSKTVYIGCRSLTAPGRANDLLLLIDFSGRDRGLPIRFSYATAFRPNSVTTKRRDYIGIAAVLLGEYGTAYLAHDNDYGARIEYDDYLDAAVTEGYQQVLVTPELDLADAEPSLRKLRKHFDALELIEGAVDLPAIAGATLEVRVDGILRETLTFASDTTRRIKRMLSCGDGHTIQFTIRTPGTGGTDIQHLAALLHFRPGGEDQSRAD